MASAETKVRAPSSLLPILIVTTALGPFAMQIFLPALPIIQADFGVSAAVAQLVFSLSAFAIALATLFYGPLSDQLGRRPAMLLGIIIFAIGSLVCALAPSISWLIFGRIIQAAGGCAGMVLSRAVIRDIYDRDDSATAIAYVTMAMVAAPMIAPALGGILTDLASWRLVFWLGIAVGALVLAATYWQLPETHPPTPGQKASSGTTKRAFGRLLRSKLYMAYALQAAFSMSVFFAFLGAASYVMLNVFGLSAGDYGIKFMTVSGAFMIGNFMAARFTRLFGVDRMIVVGSIGTLVGAAVALALVSADLFGPWGVFGPMIITAFFQGMAVPNAQAAVVGVYPEIAGTASGLGGFIQMSIAALMAQIVGSIQTGTAWPMTFGMTLAATLALACALAARKYNPERQL